MLSNNSHSYIIKSKNRQTSESISRFTYTFPRKINSINTVKIHYFSGINGIFNVNSTNNYVRLKIGLVVYEVYITQGYYSSPTLLATALQTAINAAITPSAVTVAFDTLTLKLSITPTTVYTLDVDFTSYPNGQDLSYKLLGFDDETLYSVTGTATLTAPHTVDLNYSDTLKLRIPQLSVDTEFPINVPTTGIIYYSNPWLNVCDMQQVNVNYATFELQDDHNIPWTNDYVIQLELS